MAMWFVPKNMRSKLNQRWRYGIFLGRSLSSDQNFIGLNSGDVTCARAMVRVVPNIRYSSDRISKIVEVAVTRFQGPLGVPTKLCPQCAAYFLRSLEYRLHRSHLHVSIENTSAHCKLYNLTNANSIRFEMSAT